MILNVPILNKSWNKDQPVHRACETIHAGSDSARKKLFAIALPLNMRDRELIRYFDTGQ